MLAVDADVVLVPEQWHRDFDLSFAAVTRWWPRLREGEIRLSYGGDPTAAKQVLGRGRSTELAVGLAATLAWLEGAFDAQE